MDKKYQQKNYWSHIGNVDYENELTNLSVEDLK
jgi:hypothetical protein